MRKEKKRIRNTQGVPQFLAQSTYLKLMGCVFRREFIATHNIYGDHSEIGLLFQKSDQQNINQGEGGEESILPAKTIGFWRAYELEDNEFWDGPKSISLKQ